MVKVFDDLSPSSIIEIQTKTIFLSPNPSEHMPVRWVRSLPHPVLIQILFEWSLLSVVRVVSLTSSCDTYHSMGGSEASWICIYPLWQQDTSQNGWLEECFPWEGLFSGATILYSFREGNIPVNNSKSLYENLLKQRSWANYFGGTNLKALPRAGATTLLPMPLQSPAQHWHSSLDLLAGKW